MYYAQFPNSKIAVQFDTKTSRDAYVAQTCEEGIPAQAIYACQAFKMTPPNEDGSRNFWNMDRSEVFREP
jgi:hypothetical protein